MQWLEDNLDLLSPYNHAYRCPVGGYAFQLSGRWICHPQDLKISLV